MDGVLAVPAIYATSVVSVPTGTYAAVAAVPAAGFYVVASSKVCSGQECVGKHGPRVVRGVVSMPYHPRIGELTGSGISRCSRLPSSGPARFFHRFCDFVALDDDYHFLTLSIQFFHPAIVHVRS